MTPSMLTQALQRFGLREKKVYITHMKPIFRREILSELSSLNLPTIEPLEQGRILTIGPDGVNSPRDHEAGAKKTGVRMAALAK